jgi:hypothetical protein
VASTCRASTRIGNAEWLKIPRVTDRGLHDFAARILRVPAATIERALPRGLAAVALASPHHARSVNTAEASSPFDLAPPPDGVLPIEPPSRKVVAGEAEVKRCSAEVNRELFEAALAGLGQCGIIARAIIDVVPALPLVQIFQIPYTDNVC